MPNPLQRCISQKEKHSAIFFKNSLVFQIHFPKISCKLPKFLQNSRKETRAIPCNNIGHTGRWKWLHTVFQGQYRPSLSINYVAINEHLKKLPPQMYEIKRKICHDQGCSDIRVVIAMKWRLTYYTCSNISHWELFLVYKIVQGSSFLQ